MSSEKYLGLAFLACSIVSAEVQVSLGAKVLEYRADFESGRIPHHRSGLAKDASGPLFDETDPIIPFASALDNPEDPRFSSRLWRSSAMEEYEISHGDGEEIKGLLQAELKRSGLTEYGFRAEDDVSEFSAPLDSADMVPSTGPSLPEADLVKAAAKLAKKHLKAFKGRIEFDNTEFGYMNGKVVNARLRYRRLFKNAILLKDMSYVYVKVDGRGTLKGIKVKWPGFNKVAGSEPAVELSKVMDRAVSEYANLPDARQGEKTHRPKRATVMGMAAGWLPIVDGEKTRITPCYAFAADVQFDSDLTEPTFIEVPLLEKYQGQ
jgi:hypothetical protein